jgi:lipopolysaccharide export system permease protein
MGSIGRYIFRTTLGAFLVVLASVTMLMWMTQALRNVDLMTSQGQTILVFVGITGLIIPLLILLIAPIALMIAVGFTLNKLSTDSELIVMNAAGMAPWRIFQPFLAVGIVVSLVVAAISMYVSPKSLRELRRWATEVRAEVVTSNVQPGRFAVVDGRMTMHVRGRAPNGQLLGVLIDDARDAKERVTILAETGSMLTNENGTYLILENGSVQRHVATQRDPDFIAFREHAFDLSRLAPTSSSLIRYSVQERFPWELAYPPADDTLYKEQPGNFTAELHNRITAPLYPLAFLIITFAYLGAPRTTRQSRTMSFVSAALAVSVLRGIGFVGTIMGAQRPITLLVPYLAIGLTCVFGTWAILRGVIIEPPAFVTNTITALSDGLSRRTAAVSGQTQ